MPIYNSEQMFCDLDLFRFITTYNAKVVCLEKEENEDFYFLLKVLL